MMRLAHAAQLELLVSGDDARQTKVLRAFIQSATAMIDAAMKKSAPAANFSRLLAAAASFDKASGDRIWISIT
jgi:hypothetical protein